MSRDVYSFVKIHKSETDRGVVYAMMGIFSMICLALLIAVSFAGGGKLPPVAGAVGYLSFVVSLAGLYMSYDLREDQEAYGRMVDSCLYFNIAAVAVHLIVFLIGSFAIL